MEMNFEEIYNAYFDDVYRYIRRLSGNEHVAEEITSDTFFKAMKKLDTFRGDCDLRVWLYQIAKNSYYTYLKKEKKSVSIENLDLEEMTDNKPNPEDQFITNEKAAQIQAILHTISEPYKEVFMWRIFAELSFKEIGQLFGKTNNWACVTYHRAKQEIIKKLEEQEHEKS